MIVVSVDLAYKKYRNIGIAVLASGLLCRGFRTSEEKVVAQIIPTAMPLLHHKTYTLSEPLTVFLCHAYHDSRWRGSGIATAHGEKQAGEGTITGGTLRVGALSRASQGNSVRDLLWLLLRTGLVKSLRNKAANLFAAPRVIIALLPLVGLCGCAMLPIGSPQSADEVLQGLRDEGLPIGESVNYTAETDPNDLLGRPNQYTSKVIFKDTRLNPHQLADEFDVQNGGSIEVFEDQDDAIARAEYFEGTGQSFSPFAEYSYREGTVLLRLSHHLTPDQAAAYEETFKNA